METKAKDVSFSEAAGFAKKRAKAAGGAPVTSDGSRMERLYAEAQLRQERQRQREQEKALDEQESRGPKLATAARRGGGGSGSDLMAGDRLYQDAQRRQEKLFHKQLEKEVLVIPSQ